jgi:hypothetical protein
VRASHSTFSPIVRLTRSSCEMPGARIRTRRHLTCTAWRREGVASASSGCSTARSSL